MSATMCMAFAVLIVNHILLNNIHCCYQIHFIHTLYKHTHTHIYICLIDTIANARILNDILLYRYTISRGCRCNIGYTVYLTDTLLRENDT